jgi:hypothetical protein
MTMTKAMLPIAMLIGVITVGLGFTTDVHAANCTTFHQCSGKIQELYTHASYPPGGGASVSLVDGVGGLTGCTPGDGKWLTLSTSNPLFRELYELLLNAVTFNKTVFLSMTTGSAPCDITYAIMNR